MSAGTESWYGVCERLCAGFTYKHDLPPLAVRLRSKAAVVVDVNMTDTHFTSTPTAGQKRSRDDDDDGEVVLEDAFRFEKVGHESYA